jgi:hypothetical protein
MAKTNLTLQLHEHVIRRANPCRETGTLMITPDARELDELVEQDARYGEARSRAEELMRGDRRPNNLQRVTAAIWWLTTREATALSRSDLGSRHSAN